MAYCFAKSSRARCRTRADSSTRPDARDTASRRSPADDMRRRCRRDARRRCAGVGAGRSGLPTNPLYQGEPILALPRPVSAKPSKRSKRSRSSSNRCPSWSINRACGQAAPTRGLRGTCGCVPAQHQAAGDTSRGAAAPRGTHLRLPARHHRTRRWTRSRRTRGTAAPQIAVWKWTDDDFRTPPKARCRSARFADEWTFGNVEEALKKSDLVLDEPS